MVKVPKTRYPFNIERSYAQNIKKLIKELDELVFYEFDRVITPLVLAQRMVNDSKREDSIFDDIKNAIDRIKSLSLGAFPDVDVKTAADKFTKGVNSSNKTNVNSQLKIKGVSPLETESWIKPFLEAKVEENVSYITTIRDGYTQNVEQTILRGVTSGQSTKEMRAELLKHSGMSVSKADFVARDQTGTLLGQMNAERQKRAGFTAFRWSDSGDNRVRDSHAERDGEIYYYDDNPLLPGEDYGCRCVAEPVDDDELETLEKETEKEYNYIKEKDYQAIYEESGVASEYQRSAIKDKSDGYILNKNSFDINYALRIDAVEELTQRSKNTIKVLDDVIKSNVLNSNVIADRWVDAKWLNGFFGEKRTPNKPLGFAELSDLVSHYSGELYTEKAFTSASLVSKQNVFRRKPIMLKIRLPKGTNVYVTENIHESEIILSRNSQLKIISSKIARSEYGEYLEITMEHKGVKR